VEDVEDARSWWKLKLICNRAKPLDHLIWREVLGRQLGQGTVMNRERDALNQAEPHPIADIEL
jgi:hypothetical protein